MGRKILLVCAAVLLLAAFSVSGFAAEFDPARTGEISVTLTEQSQKTPIAGAELQLYYVAGAAANEDGTLFYSYQPDFAPCGIDLNDPDLAQKLDIWLTENSVPPVIVSTDATGQALFTELALGLYLIRQGNTLEGYAPCTPFLVTVPSLEGDSYVYTVNATPKTEVAKLTDITIRKVWNTDAATPAADSVTVELLRDGQVIETALLNKENNWQITYSQMPESDSYSIREVDVPQGFKATYEQKGYVFTVTNTSTLIQTGQRILPIPILAGAGILLIIIGVALLRKKREADA